MQLHNAVNRVMSLFRTYETFPHDTEFVRLAAVPVIAADLSSRLSHLIWVDHSPMLSYQFHEGVIQMYRRGLATREFSIVQNLNLTGPEHNDFKDITMTWTTLFGPPGIQHSMKIALKQSRNDSDLEFTKAQDRIAAATKFLRDYDKQQETK